jgi:4-amino-4-deoxy-L-arabinose transferase-like glycosyltransferase
MSMAGLRGASSSPPSKSIWSAAGILAAFGVSKHVPEDSTHRHSFGLRIVFWGILLIGAALRLAWLDCGLPKVQYVDAFKFVGSADAMAQAGNFKPQEFQNPALFASLLAALDRVFHLMASPFAEHLTACFISALSGIALIGLVWRAGRNTLSEASALLAAALAAVSVILVTLSRFPLTDMIVTSFMTAGLICALEENPRPKCVLGAGVFLGLAIATKWTGLYLGGFYVILAAIRILRRKAPLRELSRLGVALVIAAVVFLVVNPWFISNYAKYAQRLSLEAQIQKYGQIGRIQLGWLDYLISSTPTCEMPWLSTSLLYSMGPALTVAALAGLVLALVRRNPPALALHALYAGIYVALIVGPGRLKAIRFLAPVLPSLFILAAGAVDACGARFPAARRRAVFVVATLLLVTIPFVKSIRYVFAARLPMTPVLAENWIREHLGDETGLCLSPFYLNNLLETLPHKPFIMANMGQRKYRLPDNPAANVELNPFYAPGLLDALRSKGIHYFVCNSWFDSAFLPVPENRRWFSLATTAYAGWRQRLEAEGELVWSVRAKDLGCLGPDIEIWRLDRSPGALTR